MASSTPPFDACFCPNFYKHNPVACFIKLHGFAYRKHGRIATLVRDIHTLTTWFCKESVCACGKGENVVLKDESDGMDGISV
jgi:hypothetical protein